MRCFLVLALLGCCLGCGQPKNASRGPLSDFDGVAVAPPGVGQRAAGNDAPADKGKEAGPDAKRAIVSRKIIYTGQVEIIVKNIDEAGQRVKEITAELEGYVAGFYIDSTFGDRRTAVFTLRLPTAQFQKALNSLNELGHVLVSRTDSQDVTDEYYDLEARIQTKQDEEKALRELLGKSTDKLENLLMIRKELARVREDIESAQGRLNKLAKLSELTTITVKLSERKEYIPPTAPTFGNRIRTTFSNSTESLVTFLKNLTLFVIALVPWSPFLLVGLGVLYWIIRRLRRLLWPVESISDVIPATPSRRE